jgi:glycerophosphoryl diester phosphodiesterase
MRDTLPKLVAHRGYAARYPENTLLAIQAAVEAGAHYVEFDIQLTADGVPVLFHDRDCMRMCGQSKPVHEYTYQEMMTFSVSEFDRFGYKFAGNPVTTLQELVGYLSNFPYVRSFVELKRISLQHFGIDKVLDKVLPIVADLHEQAVIISYSLEALLATRERCNLPIGAVFDQWAERKQPLIAKLAPEYMFTDIDELPRFGKLQCPQCELAVYECTDPMKAIKVHQRGIDLVETFAIAEMLQSLTLYSGKS